MQQHTTHPDQGVLTEQATTYCAWLELEIGLDQETIALSLRARNTLFNDRIEGCLAALENAAPGIRAKLDVFPRRPFAFTGMLSPDEIRAIWPLPELRMLSDRDASKTEPEPDEHGLLPFVVEVLEHIQSEESTVVKVERVTVIVRAASETDAKRIATEECSAMPSHFMNSDYRIHRRWWAAERAYLNSFYDEERMRHGAGIVVDQTSQPKLKEQPKWRPDASIERVTYGSPKQRPKSWEWMIS